MNYSIVKNFFTKEEVKICEEYMKMKHRFNYAAFDLGQTHGDTGFYGDPLFETFLLHKVPLVEKEFKVKVLPTYSYWRLYTFNAHLDEHKDRGSCTHSLSVHIGSCGTKWAFTIEKEDVFLESGDALFYRGDKVFHSRPHFTGDYYLQTFLHYVEDTEKNKEYHLDGREFIGGPPVRQRGQLP